MRASAAADEGNRASHGARRRSAPVVTMVLREACVLVVAGCVGGVALALLLARSVNTLVYGVEPHDPATLAASCLLLATVALGASVVPARRAARLDPMAAFRTE